MNIDDLQMEQINSLITLYNDSKDPLRRLFIENEILKQNSPWLAYYFAVGVNNITKEEEFDKLIIDYRNPHLSYLFARSKYNTNLLAHSDIVLSSNNPNLNYQFAKYFSNLDALNHGKVVIKSGNLRVNYFFAKDVRGADILGHGEVIIKSKSLEYNYLFARDIPGADVQKHGQIIIDSKNYQYNFDFARDVSGADIKGHVTVLTKHNNDRIYSHINQEFDNNQDLYENLKTIFTTAEQIKLKKVRRKRKYS